jgi:phosphate starvation-inducible PhoH-like protein
MHTAITALTEKTHSKIIISKPIVESGKSMGFLPGDEKDKIAPYRTSFDEIINTLLQSSEGQAKKIKDSIDFHAVNFVRGDTFKNAIVILSEAQNCTLHELVSFVTRLHHSSRMFINGDPMQSDIGNKSGLKDFLELVDRVNGMSSVNLGDEFQTRHPMIVQLNKEYIKFKENKNK